MQLAPQNSGIHVHEDAKSLYATNNDIEEIFETVLNSEDKPIAGPLPGSIEFHYRNHPHLLRTTRLRANRHGANTTALMVNQ